MPDYRDDSPFTTALVMDVIQRLPMGKVSGADGIKGEEMIKPICEHLTPFLTALYQLCWYTSKAPIPWRLAQAIPIHKEGPTETLQNLDQLASRPFSEK